MKIFDQNVDTRVHNFRHQCQIQILRHLLYVTLLTYGQLNE